MGSSNYILLEHKQPTLVIPLSLETIYGLPMFVLFDPLYITHAANIKNGYDGLKCSEPSVSSLLLRLHCELPPGHHGVVPPPVENSLFAFQLSAFRSGKKSC